MNNKTTYTILVIVALAALGISVWAFSALQPLNKQDVLRSEEACVYKDGACCKKNGLCNFTNITCEEKTSPDVMGCDSNCNVVYQCLQEGENKKLLCEINKEYKHDAINPIACECPDGYEFQVVSMGWGPCPQEGMQDCPASILKCVKK